MGSVDTSLYPHASGLAAKTVSAHADPHPLKLWSGWFCPFVQRSWIVLQEKNIPYQYHEVNPYKKEADFLAVNPRGLVPTLECPDPKSTSSERGRPLIESTVISAYLDESYAEPSKFGPALLPSDPYSRARCRVWIDFISTRLVPSFYRLLQHTPSKSNYSLDSAREELKGHVLTLAREMAPSTSGPYFLGAEFSLVDVSVAPWVLRLFLIEHYKTGGHGIPAEGDLDGKDGAGEDEALWRRWHVFAKAIEGRQSVKETMSEREQYVGAYRRYAEDTTQSGAGRATREGRVLP